MHSHHHFPNQPIHEDKTLQKLQERKIKSGKCKFLCIIIWNFPNKEHKNKLCKN